MTQPNRIGEPKTPSSKPAKSEWLGKPKPICQKLPILNQDLNDKMALGIGGSDCHWFGALLTVNFLFIAVWWAYDSRFVLLRTTDSASISKQRELERVKTSKVGSW